jgi:HEAT repeat protein
MGWRMCASSAVALLLTCALAHPAAGTAPLSSAGPVLEEFGKQIEDRSRPTRERLELISTFGDWATAQVRAPLVAVLKDPEPEIRAAAARALGWPGNDEAIPALRERVEAPGEVAAVRAAAVRSFGRIGDRSVRALVIAAIADPDASVREAALWGVALGSLSDPTDRTAYLIQFAGSRGFDAVARVDAIRALATVKEERVVESLSRILEDEPRLAIALPSGQLSAQQTMALRNAQIKDVAAWAAGALGQLDARSALPLLLKTAEEPGDYFLRFTSVRALVTWNVPEAFPVLVRRLEDPLPDVRVLAVTGLARLGDPKAVDPLLARLADENADVRLVAVMTLAKLGGPKVRPQLEALQDKEMAPDVRRELEAALARLHAE